MIAKIYIVGRAPATSEAEAKLLEAAQAVGKQIQEAVEKDGFAAIERILAEPSTIDTTGLKAAVEALEAEEAARPKTPEDSPEKN